MSGMTDHEIASLFFDLIATIETAIVDYTTVLFAFLVFAYFAADKLKPYMIVILLVLFTGFCTEQVESVHPAEAGPQ
jgi:hypothetical protein